MAQFTLTPEQEAKVTRMTAEPTRSILDISDTGTGKTVCTVEFCRRVDARYILVIGPVKKQIVNSWKRTFGDDYAFVHVTSANVKLLSDRNPTVTFDKPVVFYIGREYFGLANRDKLIPVHRLTPDVIVVDEIQSASGRHGLQKAALHKLHGKPGHTWKIALSATPAGNKFENLWAVTRWLWWELDDPEREHLPDPRDRKYVPRSFHRWKERWALTDIAYTSEDGVVETIIGEADPGAFIDSLPCVVRMVAQRTPVRRRRVPVELDPEHQALYDQLQTDSVAFVGGGVLAAQLPITLLLRLRQVCLGTPSLIPAMDDESVTVGFDPETCNSAKLRTLVKLIRNHHAGDKVFVLTSSRAFVPVVMQYLDEAGIEAVQYVGGMTAKAQAEAVQRFVDDAQVLVATIPAVAEGLDGLQRVCHTEVWLDTDLNAMLCHQAEGRLNRMGQTATEITRYRFVARHTVEDEWYEGVTRTTEKMGEVLHT